MKDAVIRLINSTTGVPVTGLTVNDIKFRSTPYGTDNVIANIAVSETGSEGNYICTGFTTWQLTKLFIDNVEQVWWGEQFTGDPANAFVTLDQVPNYWLLVGRKLMVDQAADVVPGHRYSNIQDAINFAQSQTPAPSSTNQWNIYIQPQVNKFNGYTEDITLQPFINLIGLGDLVTITGNINGMNPNTRLVNMFWNYSGNLVLSDIKAVNCVFRLFDRLNGFQLSLANCALKDCGLISTGGSNSKVTSTGGNVFYGKCFANTAFTPQTSDKGIVDAFNDQSVDFNY